MLKILFAENHPTFARIVIRKFLSEYDVVRVPEVRMALRELDLNVFDVVLADYDLDDGKGTEVVEAIRSRKLPLYIIAVSSHESGNTALLEAGADAVCPKIKFHVITEILNKVRI